ncbi:crAss001_48 related protein [Burkholderia pyrrocinia]
MATRPEYQQRAIDELDEMVDKLTRLWRFIETPAFNELPPEHRSLLLYQRSVMVRYVEILDEGIATFGQAGV